MKAIQFVSVPEQAAFRVRAAAKYLGISPNTLRKRTDLGLIPTRRDECGDRVYLLKDLEAYLNSLPLYRSGDNPSSRRSAGFGRFGKGEEQ
jgi:hypothetical protein